MPVRPLPPELVQRLRQLSPQIVRCFPYLPLLDHRGVPPYAKQTDINHLGTKVRELNVSRNFPQVGTVALKFEPARTPSERAELVRAHNAKFRPDSYLLREPIAYPIDAMYVVMAKVDFPTVEEITGLQYYSDAGRIQTGRKTDRGRKFFENLASSGLTEMDLTAACDLVWSRVGISPHNLLLLGIEDRKFIFMPLLDAY